MSLVKDFVEQGVSYLISFDKYEEFILNQDLIGRPDGQFCIPKKQMDELLRRYPDRPRMWEKQLGLERYSLGSQDIKRVDMMDPASYNLRPPTADMSGVNSYHLGTGKVPGGQYEAVVDPFPNPEYNPEMGQISNISIENTEYLDEEISDEQLQSEVAAQNQLPAAQEEETEEKVETVEQTQEETIEVDTQIDAEGTVEETTQETTYTEENYVSY